MGRMSAALLAAVDRSVQLVEIDLPDGTTWRICQTGHPFHSASVGDYEERMVGLPQGWRESGGDDLGAMQVANMTVTLWDGDWRLRDLLGKGTPLENCAARVYRAASAEDVPNRADWLARYTGVIDSYEEQGDDNWLVKLRPNDQAMRSPILTRRAMRQDWPNLPAANEGRLLPLLIGLHCADGDTNATRYGAIETFSVDGTNFWQYVSLGYCNVLAVFVGATLKTVTTDYVVRYPLINGIRHTVVDLGSDPAGAAVTVDVEAQYASGLGTGLPVILMVDVVRLVLNQWILPTTKWQDGAWLAESSRLYSAGWDALKTALVGRAGGAAYCSSVSIDDDRTGYDFINGQCASHRFGCYWRGDGTLAPVFDDPTTYVTPTRYLRESDCLKFALANAVSGVPAQLLRSITGEFGVSQLIVNDPTSRSQQGDTVSLDYAPNTLP